MPGPIDTLLTEWFAGMSATSTRYCVLRNYEQLPEQVGNDLDILIDHSCEDMATRLLYRLARKQGWTPLASIPYSSTVAHSFFNSENAALFTLHIDIVTDFRYWGMKCFSAEDVLIHRRRLRDFFIPSPNHEATLLALKDIIYLGSIRKSYQSRICQLLTVRKDADAILRLTRFRVAARLFLLNVTNPIDFLTHVAKHFRRLYLRCMHPPGKFIVLVGPDGAGKSSVAKALLFHFNTLYRSSYYFHWLPPILGHFSTPIINTVSLPFVRKVGLLSRGLSLARLLKHFLHAVLSYYARVRPLLSRGSAVVGDRFIYNYFLNPHSVNYHGGASPLNAAFRFLPKPDVLAVITAPADVILSRKQELSVSEIESHYNTIPSLKPFCKQIVWVDNSQTIEAAVMIVLSALASSGSSNEFTR
jgi:thymidylate kinase